MAYTCKELLSIAMIICICGSISEGAQCESGWVPGPSNNCYLFVFNPKQNWENAQAKCVEKGADLVSIDSELERTWMHGYRSANYEEEQDIWIGGYQKNGDGRFYWVRESGYNNLIDIDGYSPNGEPNNGPNTESDTWCLLALNDRQDRPVSWHWKWNDQKCSQGKAYICEKTAQKGCLLNNFRPSEPF